ncbi:hypothetical protein CPAV1605_432 [seawater metagenome]|uniref:Uncharacterized protein n=1 Tax=seawater metagenome TaxID=1561972 RepID=A0A5E8CI09_9ZZZZ
MDITNAGFYKFLNDNNVIATIVATMISQRISDLSNSFIDNLIIPVLDRDADGDGEADIKDLKKYKINFLGIKFRVGEFFIVLLKFMIILFIAYQINKIMSKKQK